MQISLIGYMGSGKSTVGRELSQMLSLDFMDLDQLIEQSKNKSISEIFDELGEIKFRKLENEILLDTLQSGTNFVLAVGGGTPVYYDNIEQINKHTISFYLRSNPQSLAQRLLPEKNLRPLIAHVNDESLSEFIAKHLFERRNFYERAIHKIDVISKPINEITEEIIRLLDLHQK